MRRLDAPMLPLKVMTWNILHQTPCEEEQEHPWAKRRDGMRKVIERVQPDILCLQEAHPEQADYLLENLPDMWWFGKDRHGGNDGEGCPVAFDTTRFALLGWEQFWMGPSPDEPDSLTWVNDVPRIVTVGRFEHYATGKRFAVANVHMDHLVPTSRTKAINLLKERLPEGTEEMPLVLVGDFNSPAWSKPHRLLMKEPGRFYDTFRMLRRGAGPLAGTFHHFKGKGFMRVDWILTQPKLEVERLDILHDTLHGIYPSDHFPVVADLFLPLGEEEARPRAATGAPA